ncbi:hypothetical protein [uncultured Capnocytophaga sp.]|uniref:hypothetical protein n=1 Tax=uncultured Capnocytophaga sp. TaxID=159273 RepID=UPI0028E42FCD|nr:hypothetical protein [uncultured Capnocytophaga sp.]
MKRFITYFFIITLFTMVTYGQSGIKKPDWQEKKLVGKVKKLKEKMVFFDDKKQYVAFAKGEGSPSDIENVSITYVFNQRGYIESFISENGDKVPIKYDYRNRTATQIYKKKPGSPAMEIICEFDPLKNMISQTLKMGEQTITEKYKLTYNDKWQVVEEKRTHIMSEEESENSPNSLYIYKYNKKGYVIEQIVKEPNSSGDWELKSIINYQYNDRGNVSDKIELEIQTENNRQEKKYHYEYTYDNIGNYIKKVEYLISDSEEEVTYTEEREIKYYK